MHDLRFEPHQGRQATLLIVELDIRHDHGMYVQACQNQYRIITSTIEKRTEV